jgi:hypothetical protein
MKKNDTDWKFKITGGHPCDGNLLATMGVVAAYTWWGGPVTAVVLVGTWWVACEVRNSNY